MAKRKKKKGSADREKFLLRIAKEHVETLTNRATIYELEFKQLLIEAGIEFVFQYPIIYERQDLFILDFFLPEYNIAFEIDGWQHDTKEGRRHDRQRTKKLKEMGITVKRIRNFNVKLVTVDLIRDSLKTNLK